MSDPIRKGQSSVYYLIHLESHAGRWNYSEVCTQLVKRGGVLDLHNPGWLPTISAHSDCWCFVQVIIHTDF